MQLNTAQPKQLGILLNFKQWYGHTSNTVKECWLIHQQALLVGEVTWAVAVTFIRASILALYIRVFRTKSFRWACYVFHGVNAAFGAATILGACLICLPIAYNWDHSIAGGYCGNQKSLDLFIGIFNLLMDVTVVVLPMPVLWRLQMAVGRKIVLSMMFGLGVMYVSRLPLSPVCSQYLRRSFPDKIQYLCHNAHSHSNHHGTYISESSFPTATRDSGRNPRSRTKSVFSLPGFVL